MISVDTNILVYAHRKDSAWHEAAASCIRELAEGRGAWAVPWPCLHEFYAIVTHPGIYDPPTKPARAAAQIEAWLESPSLVLLAETDSHWSVLNKMLEKSKVTGPRVHDARVAALCVTHGVRELWTADRDFSRYRDLRTHNPLLS
jgi:toxin-antitoxin system PIN domain toxin